MASVELSADVPISPQDTWDHVSELSELGEWLVIHEGWRSELPDQLGEGVQIVGVARAMGMRNRVTWGTKYGVTLTVRPTKGGSALGLRLELGGRALFGPLGSAAARAVKGDVEKSLKQFAELYG